MDNIHVEQSVKDREGQVRGNLTVERGGGEDII